MKHSLLLSLLLALWVGAEAEAGAGADAEAGAEAETEAGAGAQGLPVRLWGQLFTQYDYTDGTAQNFNEFSLPRAEAGVTLWPGGNFGGELRVEAIRSAGGQSVTGVDVDSLVLRLKRAWGFANYQVGGLEIEGRAGLLPETWIEALEGVYDFRGMAPTLGERAGFYDTSDLGVSVVLRAWKRRAFIAFSLLNGEGRNQTEQNSFKDLSGLFSLRAPQFSLGGVEQAVSITVAGRIGRRGPAETRTNRWSAAVSSRSRFHSLGVEFTHAEGVLDNSQQVSQCLGGWVSGHIPSKGVGMVGRIDYIDQSGASLGDIQRLYSGSLFYDAFSPSPTRRVRIYVTGQVEKFGRSAGPLPGIPESADNESILVTLSLAAGERIAP